MSPPALQASGLEKEYGEDSIVTGADLQVRDGEILVLMGPNGVGKTVLLSCLAGSEPPTDGSIEVFGRPVGAEDGDALMFLLQDTMVVETLTGRENVDFYSRLHHRFTDRWREYVTQLDIAADLDDRVDVYSAGMKRKLELTLTMSVDVPLYILDEPTAGVDLTNIQRFHDIILEGNDDGKTFLISSHRPLDADIADRIAFMPDGAISSVGDPDELLAAVPPVVRVTGTDAMDTAERFVVDGSLFPLGGEARGFLREETTIGEFREELNARTDAELIDPTYTDLFNYYVHVEP